MSVRLVCFFSLLLGCRGAPPAPAADLAPAPAPRPAPPARPPHAPMSQDELATTDGGIAASNLEAQIQGSERLLRERPQDPAMFERLAALLQVRGQYFGRIADYERAAELAERMVRLAPKEARPYLVRSQLRSTFHRFADALGDLER